MARLRSFGLVLSVIAAGLLFGCQGSLSPETASPTAEPTEPTVVTLTPKSAAEITGLVAQMRDEDPPRSKLYLRVRVVPGGCQGFMHKLDLDLNLSAEDQICVSEGVSIVIFKRQAEMLRGTLVDFGDEDGKRGFKVDNPNFKGEGAKKWLAALGGEEDIK